VRGLTTAARIWFVAALGIAVGQWLCAISFASTAIAILTLLARPAHRIPSVGYQSVHVSGRAEDVEAIERSCRQAPVTIGFCIAGISARLSKETGGAKLTLRLRTRNAVRGLKPSKRLLDIPEVREVTWE